MSTQIRGAQIRDLFAGDGLDWVAASGTGRNILAVQVDDSSIGISGDALYVKALGITNAMISGSISDDKLVEDYIKTSEVDGSTIEFGGGTLNIVAAGVTETELNPSVAGDGLTGGGGSALSINTASGIGIVSDNVVLLDTVAGDGLAYAAGVLSVNTTNGLETTGDAVGIASSAAGAGLSYTTGVLAINAGDGLELSGDNLQTDLKSGGGLKIDTAELAVEPNDFAGDGLEDDGSDNLRLKASVAGDGLTHASGVLSVNATNGCEVVSDNVVADLKASGGLKLSGTEIMVEPADFAGDGLSDDGSDNMKVNVDDSTIEIDTDALRVKDGGITEVKLGIVNAPVDTYYLQYTAASGMQWTDIEATTAVTESDIRLENETASCNGATTAFTLDVTPVDNSLQVFLNGLIQEKGSGLDYTHTGTTVTFGVAPLAGDILLIHYTAKD